MKKWPLLTSAKSGIFHGEKKSFSDLGIFKTFDQQFVSELGLSITIYDTIIGHNLAFRVPTLVLVLIGGVPVISFDWITIFVPFCGLFVFPPQRLL